MCKLTEQHIINRCILSFRPYSLQKGVYTRLEMLQQDACAPAFIICVNWSTLLRRLQCVPLPQQLVPKTRQA